MAPAPHMTNEVGWGRCALVPLRRAPSIEPSVPINVMARVFNPWLRKDGFATEKGWNSCQLGGEPSPSGNDDRASI